MPVDRRVLSGGFVLVTFVAVVHVLSAFMPVGSAQAATLVDLALPLLETGALALTCIAFHKNRSSPYRWTWLLLGLWLLANLVADGAYGWYEVVLRTSPPTPSVADFGYLISYPLAFLTVVFSMWKAAGRLRAAETALDAMMFTLGAAGLAWPLLLAPLLRSADSGTEQLISLAYPLGDLLVIMAFASVLLGPFRGRPPRFLIVIWVAFLIQVVADSLYFVTLVQKGSYQSGGLLDSLWALVFALAGVAALMGMYPGARRARTAEGQPRPDISAPRDDGFRWRYSRVLVPYLALPLVGAMLWMQFTRYGVRWTSDTGALVYLGIGLVALLVIRQYVTLLDNRRLTAGLSNLSKQLGGQVDALAELSDRLEELNVRANHLNSLRTLAEVMQSGLELARSVAKCESAWIALNDADGTETVAAAVGRATEVPEIGTATVIPTVSSGVRPQEVRLSARAEHIGTLWLSKSVSDEDGPDLTQAVAAHLATAIDNVRRYEEALRLAERDPLTGLLNHGGIHDRLALEGTRVEQHGGRLSVVMLDLDDFKLLNDTYGHPAGDKVLAKVSDIIRGVLRHRDFAGRVGGDEMMLVLPDTDREGAFRLAERLRHQLGSKPFTAGKGPAIPLRLSFGLATYPDDADSLARLVGAADASLYASKQRGGDTITDAGATEGPEPAGGGLQSVASRLMDVVGARDHYTRRHSDQVVIYASHLGEVLGLPKESLETLRLAALLHDVGKIGLRPRLLRKPAPLTSDEECTVRTHVDIGESIIRDLPRVAEVLEVVHSHHERHDGSGYPRGLAGEEIPLLARILAVADAYSAMVANRPYRRRLTTRQAKAELMKVAGTQLDPALVDRFLADLKDKRAEAWAATG